MLNVKRGSQETSRQRLPALDNPKGWKEFASHHYNHHQTPESMNKYISVWPPTPQTEIVCIHITILGLAEIWVTWSASELDRIKTWEIKKSVWFSDIPVTLTNQGHQNWHWSVKLNWHSHRAKFERSCLRSLREKAYVKKVLPTLDITHTHAFMESKIIPKLSTIR